MFFNADLRIQISAVIRGTARQLAAHSSTMLCATITMSTPAALVVSLYDYSTRLKYGEVSWLILLVGGSKENRSSDLIP